MTWIGLIRHGITDWNEEGRAQGQTDIPLNETGRAQAAAIVERLRTQPWDFIYSSDLSRARVTAETIAKALGKQVQLDSRLREMRCGRFEGTTVPERAARWGANWKEREAELGVESEDDIAARGLAAIREIAGKHRGKRILIVSHGALLGLSLTRLIPHLDSGERLHNTSFTLIEQTGDNWACRLFNCKAHLEA